MLTQIGNWVSTNCFIFMEAMKQVSKAVVIEKSHTQQHIFQ